MQFASSTPNATHGLGVRLGRLAQPGDVLLFQGELGSGKTVLAQGVGEGLAVQEPVTSSSYVLMAEYYGRLTLYHADLFRLDDPAQVAELALEEVAATGVLIVEWPERAWGQLPAERLLVVIEETEGEETESARKLTLTARGARYDALLEALANDGSRREESARAGG